MTDTPQIGAKVKVWPRPGRNVQDGALALDSGGRWLKSGREIKWSEFHLDQYRAGDILLHDPAPAAAPAASEKKKEAPHV